MKKKTNKKKNVQHVVRDPAKEADWGSTNPFANPLFYILGIIFLPVWYFDAVKSYGHSGAAVFETIAGIVGMIFIFFCRCKYIKISFYRRPQNCR